MRESRNRYHLTRHLRNSRQHEQGSGRIRFEGEHVILPRAQQGGYCSGSAVSQTYPYHLGRMAVQECSLLEIRVLRDNHESVLGGVISHDLIVGVAETDISDMNGRTITLRQQRYEPVRQF